MTHSKKADLSATDSQPHIALTTYTFGAHVMTDYTAILKPDHSVDYSRHIEPKNKLVCASYDPSSGILSKTYAIHKEDGKRRTIHVKQLLNIGK